MKTMGDYARAARMRAGLQQKELAKRSGLPPATISNFEMGKTTPRIDTVELLADALGLSIDEYIGHEAAGREST